MIIDAIDAVNRELFAVSVVFMLIGGVDDLLIDCLYILLRVRGSVRPVKGLPEDCAECSHRFAVFVPAWDESAVIEPMLRAMLARWPSQHYRIYVGTYPNDSPTIAAVARVAQGDARVRLVIGAHAGPTTKADCLNGLWRALERDEAAEDAAFTAIVLHDAEDVVHPQELAVYAASIERNGAVQLPVTPLRQPGSLLVSGHYLDEFAQSHGLTLLVRQMLGASLPLAGVGCAIRCDVLRRIAATRGQPFDATSLTEDYELGLALRAMGERCAFVRVAESAGGPPVAVRAYFPATVPASVRQKARWMAGIALAGWDRTGWGRPWDWCDHWMRMRDRRVTLAMPVLAIAYASLLLWGLSSGVHGWTGTAPPPLDAWLATGIALNMALLGWRLLVRMLLVTRLYGIGEGLLSAPRMIVANYIGLLAARRALSIYVRLLLGGPVRWDKTAHHFPDAGAASMASAATAAA
ncbi:glycosyl transferase family protein [Sphingomonas sp. R1]|uniref:glycosyl transferase family protein n=1 Tax=Sphingomonas sp. R1 TaxID=399176 RepID=UPI0022252691|nr:glycosyl transferase family protein [Sphingomonas sp. R1]UYY76041.1 glycosyl transferase family protein [Sphingomonas sp. R1]